ncbi:hypothetical protein GJ496_002689 [Pomphorhynchus laevis]|nr:hypothetical protein GJ496_002689 [Pomphorhynchus laevis]
MDSYAHHDSDARKDKCFYRFLVYCNIYESKNNQSCLNDITITTFNIVVSSITKLFILCLPNLFCTGIIMSVFTILTWANLLLLVAYANAEVFLDDNFSGSDGLKDWVVSTSDNGQQMGKFELSNKKYSDDTSDFGLKTTEDSRFYWISKKFKPTNCKDQDFVVQYSLAFEQDIDCGGGYVKLYGVNTDQSKLNGDTPYYIMFGPDICGPSKQMVHVILNHNSTNYDCLSNLKCKKDVFTHVYTLIIKTNRTYIVKIDNKEIHTGELYEDWKFLPPKQIKDPNSVKPSDWDDRQYIDDPKDEKPDDWEKTKLIKDTNSKKPSDWNEEEDGEWEPPMIENPDYKGEWKPKSIPNPDYKGAWKHPMIDNPDYFEDTTFASFEDIGILGIDIWQVKSGTIYDNFLITDDVNYAESQAKLIVAKMELEKKQKQSIDDKEREEMNRKHSENDASDIDDHRTKFTEKTEYDEDEEAYDSDIDKSSSEDKLKDDNSIYHEEL